ncbi:MAG: PH domain-containing protein [Fodinibius sp.]|nr:PH domain-containing protein [Fodinibius sp.]
MSDTATVLRKASFNPKIKTYLLIYGAVICICTIVGILLLPFYFLFAYAFINKYFNKLSAELTSRALRFEKGVIFHVERTIPLDKIQDLTFKEGPLLRYFGLSVLRVETAGSSGQGQADLTLIGIKDAADFRSQVLTQRDVVTENRYSSSSSASDEDVIKLLGEIRDSLKTIEQKIGN